MAKLDALTSLHNRCHLEDVLPKFFEEAIRTGRPLSVVFIDIDHFKRVNDTYGHQAGDAAIKFIADILLSAIRAADLLARYGGEEFVCLLTNAGPAEAVIVAERMRTAVSSYPLRIANNVEIPITVSLGCATMSLAQPLASAAHLLREADRCLYLAKQGGRNKVVSGAGIESASDSSLPGEYQQSVGR